MDGISLKGSETDVRDAALRYITPGGTRKVVRRPRTDVESTQEMIPYRDGFISTRVWGGADAKTVLLVHGWAANQTDMFPYIPKLLETGFRVVAMDLPAHGESSFETAGLNHLGDAVLIVGNHYGALEGVIAHSVGCAATQVAISNGLEVHRVVLLASPNNYEAKTFDFAKSLGLDDEQTKRFISSLKELDVRVEIRSKDFVPQFEKPALIVHSADDSVIPIEIGEQLAEMWRNSTFLKVDGLNHRGVLKDDFVIRSAVEFLVESRS